MIKSAGKSNCWLRLFSLVLLICLLASTSQIAFAGMAIAKIAVTQLNSDAFPKITANVLVRDGNNSPIPSADLSNLEVVEKITGKETIVSDTLHNFEIKEIQTEMEIVYVLDFGLGSSAVGATKKARADEMKELYTTFIGTVKPGDTNGVLTVIGSGLNWLQPLTSDRTSFANLSAKFPKDGSGYSSGILGLEQAVLELSKSPAHGKTIQSIIFISNGIQEQFDKVDPVKELAKANGIYLHTILVHNSDAYAEPLRRLADATGGIYFQYTGDASRTNLINWLTQQRIQNAFTYHSDSGTTSDRTVEIRVKGAQNPLAASKSYRVDVLPPVVVIIAPVKNATIERLAKIGDTAVQAEPGTMQVNAKVQWPDGHSRDVTKAQLLVDGQAVGNPLSFPGDEFSFTWDLKNYSAGEHSPKIQIAVVDELALQATSETTTVNIKVTVPAVPIPSGPDIKSACEGTTGFASFTCAAGEVGRSMVTTPTGWISIVSLLIAMVAIVMALRFRANIAQAGGNFIEAARETIARLTRPANIEAGAYLEVLRGEDTLVGKKIPLYMRTVTPVGRDRQVAELIFDRDNPNSVVSRRHCEFREENGEYKLRDLGASHGTFINGIRLPEGGDGQTLQNGDKIELGPVERGGILLLFSPAGEESPDDKYKTNPAYHTEDLNSNPAYQESSN